MSNPNSSASGGAGFISLLTLLFIALKLTGHINWSWFWVLSPIIFVLGLTFLILSLVGITYLIEGG